MLLLLVFGVRGCLDARKERALKDYVRDVGALVQESDQQSEALFELLRNPGDANEVDIENQLNTFRNQASQLVDRARGHRPPGRRGRRARLPGGDVRVPPRRRGQHRRAAAERPRRPGRPQRRLRGHRRGDAELPHQRRDLPDALHAAAEHRAEGRRTSREKVPREQLPARHRVAAARASWPTASRSLGGTGGGRRRRARACTATASPASRSAARRSPRAARPSVRLSDDLKFVVQVPTRARTPRPT